MRVKLGCVHALPLILAVGLLAGCSDISSVTGNDEKTGTQSETAAATSTSDGKSLVVVAFNDDTDSSAYISFAPTTRTVLAGASQMGWAYSADQGVSWTYGGKLVPTSDWPIYWGDPAITTSGLHPNVVYMSNLAVPKAKYDVTGTTGVIGSFSTGTGLTSPLGGACIARSSDGGQTFTLQQCVTNTDLVPNVSDSTQGHLYDGGNLASNAQGGVFAAYIDIPTSQVDVWYSPTDEDTASFVRLPNPFPDLIALGHPILRVGPDGSLYVAVLVKIDGLIGEDTPFVVYINRYFNGAWGQPRQATHSTYSKLLLLNDFQTDPLGPVTLRAARQFSFDVGVASPDGSDAIRFLFTRQDPSTQLLYVDATVCTLVLDSDCSSLDPTVQGWTLGPSAPQDAAINYFSPNLVAFGGIAADHVSPTWQATILYTLKNSATVFIARMTLGYVNDNVPLTIPIDIVKDTPICPDVRGYWGDYDAFLWVGLQGKSPVFMRFFTNSSPGCTKRWQFTAEPQHVAAVRYAF